MNNLERHVLRLIGEDVDNPDVFTDDAVGLAPIRDSINDALQEMCMVTGSYVRNYYLPLLENRIFYRLAPVNDFVIYPVMVWDRTMKRKLIQTDLVKLSQEDPWWMKRTGAQLQYMMLGLNVFVVWMTPSAKGIVLELQCACIPKPYDSDVSPIKVRESFQTAAVYYAVGEFYASRGDAKRAIEYTTKYLETAGLMLLNPQTADRKYQYKTEKTDNA
jgi:hypothetical protein